MNTRVGVAVAVVLLAVAGCSGGGDTGGSSKPSAAKEADSPQAKECFVGVIKALTQVFGKVKGDPAGDSLDEEGAFGEFGVKASGTPTWDIFTEYEQLGVRELAQGQRATTTDALAAYAPSIKLECVRAYG